MGCFAFRRRYTQGFTLIELLIVIVIIGILTGVMVVIIDPQKQQNKASDATIIASMSKIILSTEGFVSSYGRVPTEYEFISSLHFRVRELFGRECSYVLLPDYECLFFIDGINIPTTCDLTFWKGSLGDNQLCTFRYIGQITGDPERFRLYVKSMGIVDTLFVFDNREGGKIFECPPDINDIRSLTTFCR